nr:AAA family ATPase [Deinococcus humi]
MADLRAHLPPDASGGAAGVRRGSLRWLEGEMRARGTGAAAVRNIIYRDIGTSADRETLRAILTELAAEVGRPLPATPTAPAPAPTPLPAELELLGRSKKRAYRQFLAGVRAGRCPRLIVTGRAGAGKTVLLDSLDFALREAGLPVKRLFLSGDVSGLLGLGAAPGTAYAQLAAAQSEAARRQLPASGTLLVRVTDDLNFAASSPRSTEGSAISPARWAVEHLLNAAPPGLAVLLALEDAAPADLRSPSPGVPPPETIALHPPTPAEARGYLMARLGVPRAEAELLVAETGRHLDRLSLLVRLRGGEAGADTPALLADPDIRGLAGATAALAACTPHLSSASWPPELLRAALRRELRQLPPHARALLAGSDALGWTPTPALRAAWTGVEPADRAGAVGRLAGLLSGEGRPVRLAALAALEDWPALAAQVRAQPDDARWLPPLWPAIRHGAVGEIRDELAGAVVRHFAGRGDYHDARLRDALFTLLEAAQPPVRAWARVKLAESSLEAGNMTAAAEQLAHPEVCAALSAPSPARDPWTVAACADALLVRAALARWGGDLEAATYAVSDPRVAVGGPRAGLWRGLIAKDAGRWDEALCALASVPVSSPLLSARARYQEGDLRLRLGQPATALEALRDAAARLEAAGAGAEECARVLTRSATALRRLGKVQEAQVTLDRALALLPPDPRRHADHVPRARLLSEGIPVLLALGRPDDALMASIQALALLAGRSARPAEVRYRQRRTRYRVALAYLTRGLGGAYLQPLLSPAVDHPDLQRARALLDDLIAQQRPGSPGKGSDRDGILLFDMYLSRALADPDPAAALDLVDRALALAAHPYEQAQARAMRAEVQVRAGSPADALAELNRAHALMRRVQPGLGDAPDPGLQAQLLTLEGAVTLGDGAQTLDWLRVSLADPALAPFRAGVWRALGRVLEEHGQGWTLLRSMYGVRADALAHLRPGDALWLLEMGGGGMA